MRGSPQRPSSVASLKLDRISSPNTPGAYYTPRTSPGLQSPRVQAMNQPGMQRLMSPRLESPRLEYLQGEIEALKQRQMDQLAQAKVRALHTREQFLAASPNTALPPPPQTYKVSPPSVSTMVNQAYLSHGPGHRAAHRYP